MALYTGRILMRIGNEANYDIDKLMPGEWAVSTDKSIVRICVSAGIGIRMATYEAFEKDMAKIEKILNQCQTIQEAIVRINTEVSEKSDAVAEYTASAKQYRDEAEQFKNESEQFKNEAFSTTPEGYETLVQNVADNTVKIDTVINKAELNIKNTASGDSIHLTDSADGKVIELSLYGKAKQYIGTGKNLLENNRTDKSDSGIQFTVNKDKSVTVNGKSTSSYIVFSFPFTPNFTGMVKLTGSSSDVCFMVLKTSNGKDVYADESKTTLQTLKQGATNKEVSYYVENGKTYSAYIQIRNIGETIQNLTVYPMIRLAEIEDDTYEPYGGNTPSPYCPQDIELSGASGSVVVKSCGKNLLKNMLANMSVSGVNLTVNEDKSISIVGTNNHTGIIAARINESFFLEKGTYIANGSIGGNGSNYRWNIYKKDGTLLLQQGDGDAILELTEKTELYAQIIITKGATVNTRIYPMIRFASYTDGTYEPYKETTTTIQTPNGHVGIPAENGGNYTDETGQQWICDEVVKYADGTGERIQRIKKIVFDGVNLKVDSTTGTDENNVFYAQGKTPDYKVDTSKNLPNILSSHFIRKSTADGYWGTEPCIYQGTVPNIYMNFGIDIGVTTVALANEWLKSNNVTVYYELAEPIRTPLTAEEIAEIEKLKTFYPVTHITNDSACGMNVTYLADSKNYIDNQLAAQAQAQEAAMISMLLLMPEETQAAMIENDTNNLLTESEE